MDPHATAWMPGLLPAWEAAAALEALRAGGPSASPGLLLAGLALLSLLGATLLPGGSELALLGLVQARPELAAAAWAAASAGNIAGGLLTWAMGRGLAGVWRQRQAARPSAGPPAPPGRLERRARAWLARWGAPACVLSWLPGVGDPLLLVAGALRLPAGPCLAWMAAGKAGRYALILAPWGG